MNETDKKISHCQISKLWNRPIFSTALLVVHHIPVRGTIGLLIIRTRGQLIVIPLGKE